MPANAPRPQQALVEQRLHESIGGGAGPRREVEHRLGGVEREAALEHRALGERRLLQRRSSSQDQSIAAAQRGLARRRAAGAGEQHETVAQPLDDLRRAQQPHPRGRQLDRQRHAVEQPHDLRPPRRVARVEREAGQLRPGAQHEQRERVIVQRQRLEREHAFAGRAAAARGW